MTKFVEAARQDPERFFAALEEDLKFVDADEAESLAAHQNALCAAWEEFLGRESLLRERGEQAA